MEERKIDNPNLVAWRCISCAATLGFVDRKESVRIKRQDVYIEVTGGSVKMNCYRCGKTNELIDDSGSNINLKEVK